MAPKQLCAKYQYVVTPAGPKILPVEEPSYKDEECPADYNVGGYLPVKVGDSFKNGRYRVVRKLGWGHFSTVWLVKDTHSHHHSALKVVKSAGRYAETARDEIKLLTQVAAANPSHAGRDYIVSFMDSFYYQGPEASHVCIVFEPLGENLLALIERNKKKGVPRGLVRVIAKQVLLGLQYLHDECDLVHTDIKPENILISILDIETHIQNELSQSPSPLARNVGVPQPTRSRAGVSIPQNQQRARRQVQIFNSQPLVSPGRSLGRRSGHNSLSMSTRDGRTSGTNSASGSYVPQMQLSKISASSTAEVVQQKPSKLSTGYSNPDLGPDHALSTKNGATGTIPNGISPSTSSTSSSMSSTVASTAANSSMISTPATSLSNSLGNVLSGFTKKESSFHKYQDRVQGKRKIDAEQDLIDIPSSWKDIPGLPGSWKNNTVGAVSSSYKSGCSPPKSKLSQSYTSNNSCTRTAVISSDNWKDPGTAAPAPAVLVSAVARADGTNDTGDFFDITKATTATTNGHPSMSETSSATTTIAQPTRSGTPNSTVASSAPNAPNTAAEVPASTADVDESVASEPCPKPSNQNPSLLTQTAPSRGPQCLSSPLKAGRKTSPRQLPPVKTSVSEDSAVVTPAAPPPTPAESPSEPSSAPVDDTSLPTAIQINADRSLLPEVPLISVKIADLGNATPSRKHYTEDIQTRQYRAPEAILGRRDWDARVDIWSVACLVFELLTAEFLFDPHGQGELFTKDDDHMAQIIELVGDFDMEVKMGGRYSRELFDHNGALRYIKTLKPWPLKRVMIEKYLFTERDSAALCDFLHPMLVLDFRQRAHARDLINHSWLEPNAEDQPVDEW